LDVKAIVAELACDALPDGIHLVGVRGREGLNHLGAFDVALVSADPLDDAALVGEPAALKLVDEREELFRVIGLVIVHVEHGGEDRDGQHYTLHLAPEAYALTLRSGYRVFQEKTVKEIVEKVLDDAGIDAARRDLRLQGTYRPRMYCVQYGEIEWAFIERLLAEEGISYWFDTRDDDSPMLVLADAAGGHDSLPTNPNVPFTGTAVGTGMRRFLTLERTEQMVTTAVHVRDFDVRAPDVPIEAKAGEGPREYFEYPARVLDEDAAKARAAIRVEQLARLQVTLEGTSDCIRLRPGRVVTISGAADEWHNGSFVVVALEHELSLATPGGRAGSPYVARATLVPHGEVAVRPGLPENLPRVEGFEPGIVTGPAGEEIHVDDLGRVKIRFPWDRAAITDDKSSYWVRSLQMNMTGSMLLPRVGWEVPVAYIDGDPDRPFVLGRAYNGNSTVPYSLPGGSATTTLQSATSPGDGTTNEIRMGDSGGSQEVFVNATKDQTVVVGGAQTTDVSVDQTRDIALTLRAAVTSSQSTSVSANQSVNVGTDYGITADGSRSETIGALEHIKVTANRNTVCSSYTEIIGALYGVQCNQSNTSVKGTFLQLVGAALAQQGGLGVTETVVAARTELVAGAKMATVARGVSENVTGARVIEAGACNEKAGGKVLTKTKVAGRITVGGTAKMVAGGAFAIEAPSISIKASSLVAGALEMNGGALKATSGKTAVDAPSIKRQGGGSIG
jgi:type VI secretion system secreted protein VgrG